MLLFINRIFAKGARVLDGFFKVLNKFNQPAKNQPFKANDLKGAEQVQSLHPDEPMVFSDEINRIREQRVVLWFADNGDKTHRLNYNLTEESTVFDLGGYEGDWASDIFCRYNCQIHIFEPTAEFAENIKNRFSHNKKVNVHPFGLSAETQTVSLYIDGASSSAYKKNGAKIEISLVKAIDFLRETQTNCIDLMKINIEGGEYDLLNHLLDTGYVSKIKNIQVQFHDFIVDDAAEKMKFIQQRLEKTHFLTYHYEFIWENWELKPESQTIELL